MRISSNFDAGNIECLDGSDPGNVLLEISKDNNSDFYQWFYFRVTAVRDRQCAFRIVNAIGAAYPKGWKDYRAVASYDRDNWFRVDTDFDGESLIIRHRPQHDSIYYAYFAPYSLERHADFIARCLLNSAVRLEVPGVTIDGRDIDLLRVGEPGPGKRKCWFVGRQHPGETMAEWWMEGFLDRLLRQDDPVAKSLLGEAVFYVVPNMNPDGSWRGHLRTNAAGANLNREWAEPTLTRSPEVFLIRQKMQETGVDFCLDVHGDEALPYNFIVGTSGIPSLTEKQSELLRRYQAALVDACPDFQTKHGYPENKPGNANLSYCSNNVAETFGCLAMTLEQPFKDAANAPNPETGWSPARSRALGAANLDALAAVVSELR